MFTLTLVMYWCIYKTVRCSCKRVRYCEFKAILQGLGSSAGAGGTADLYPNPSQGADFVGAPD